MKNTRRPTRTYLSILVFSSLLLAQHSVAQEADDLLNLESKRQTLIDSFGTGIPDPNSIRSAAKELFAMPIEGQSMDELEKLAREANAYANLVGRIENEYDDAWRSNSRYEFVQKKIEPGLIAYQKLGNEFKAIRNRAYMNLGRLSETNGEPLKAFFYYNDAYRLSVFDCEKGSTADTCDRLAAEEHMKELLGVSGINSYVTWQN